MSRLSVSVIISTHNHSAYIKETFRSVLEQKNNNFDLEIIVVDDRSTDNTWAVLTNMTKEHDFILIRTPSNSGPSTARNLALKKASGDWINFLDGDDYLLPGKIAIQLECFNKHPMASVIYTDCLIKTSKQIEDIPLSQLWPPAQGQIYTHLLLRNCIALHAGLVEASIAKRYKFDESLRTAEDYDFWLRIAHDENEFVYIDQPLVVYRRSGNSLSKPTQEVYDNTLRVLDKNQRLVKTPQQHKNLDYHRSVILQNKADLYLKGFKRQGMELLLRASELDTLPRYKLFGLGLMRRNFWFGALCYNILDIRSRWRAKWHNRNQEVDYI